MNAMEKFKDLPSDQQTRIKRAAIIIGFLVVAMFIYYGTGRDEEVQVVESVEKDPLVPRKKWWKKKSKKLSVYLPALWRELY